MRVTLSCRGSPPGLVAAVAGALAGVLVATSDGYGFHRDELYFLAAGQRPAFGYVDQPPMTPLVARASVALFGATPGGLRAASTLAGVLTVVVIAMVCRELGADVWLRPWRAPAWRCQRSRWRCSTWSRPPRFDLLGWVVVAWLVVRVLCTGDGRWWLAVSVTIGIALMNKHLVLLLIASLGVALLVVGPRQVLKSGWLLAGIGLALVLAGPNLVWQATHGWPQLTVASGISAQDGAENRMLFVPLQLVYLSPLFVPVWAAGLWRLWKDPPPAMGAVVRARLPRAVRDSAAAGSQALLHGAAPRGLDGRRLPAADAVAEPRAHRCAARGRRRTRLRGGAVGRDRAAAPATGAIGADPGHQP
jgi:hypothetical protein